MRQHVLRVLVLLVACAEPPATTAAIQIERAVPDHGPLRGGTRIELVGTGFTSTSRVLIGGREAPLVDAITDRTLHVVIPPGAAAGDAELVVFQRDGSASATGVFRYSAPPVLAAVAPAKVVYTRAATLLTLTGSGFADEGAGAPSVLVDGQLASDPIVVDDTTLTVSVPAGPALVRPTIEILNERGTARLARAFHYVPSERAGLLLFPSLGQMFALFLDPRSGETVPLPWNGAGATRFSAVVRDDAGELWAIDRAGRFGPLDARGQRIEPAQPALGLYPTVTRAGTDYVAIDRNALAFGRVDLATSAFTRVGTETVPCCGSYGLAWDGTTLYMTARVGQGITIRTVDPATGAFGTPVTLAGAPWLHVEEMRFLDGVLYASSRDHTLVTIDPASGTVTELPFAMSRFGAMEVLE